jgi:hypothetical protein
MEQKAVPLPAQFGSFVVPAARAISAPASFVGVTFQFVGRVNSVLDSDEGTFSIGRAFSVGDPVTGSITYDDHLGAATGPAGTRAVYTTAPAATLTIGSSFSESLPFAQSLPGLEMVVEKDTGGHSLNFGSDFSPVKTPIFPTSVEVAMVISLTHSAGIAFLRDAVPSNITLHDFDDTQFLITFFDAASGSVSFLEVELERFTAKEIPNSVIRESLAQARRDVAKPANANNRIPQERRLTIRRAESGRGTLHARSNGEERRHRRGRRKEDKRDTTKGILARIFSLQGAGSM